MAHYIIKLCNVMYILRQYIDYIILCHVTPHCCLPLQCMRMVQLFVLHDVALAVMKHISSLCPDDCDCNYTSHSHYASYVLRFCY